jgi:integrase
MSVWVKKREERKRQSNNIHTHTHTYTLKCPECGSINVHKDDVRQLKSGEITQLLKCNSCDRKFSENYIRCQGLGGNANYALLEEAKKLDSQTEIKTVARERRDADKGKVVQYNVYLEKQGYADSTRRLHDSVLRTLMTRNANLGDSESVKEVIAKQKWSESRRRNVILAYSKFLEYLGLTWEQPKFKVTRKIPFIPTEQEIDELIAGCSKTIATFLLLLKETAMRSGEAYKIKWVDVDFNRKTITCNEPEKGSLPRIFSNISGKLLNMLSNMPRTTTYVFGETTLNSLKATFSRSRRRLSYKLQNKRLREIHFHTLRHWKATMEYHYKPDLLYVAEFLGHKEISNTRMYIQLEKNLFKNLPNDSFITRIAKNTKEACELVQVGFDYVTGEYDDGGKIFRKRK